MQQRRTRQCYPTLSGFCLQYLITDWVFSHPPMMNSYMGSASTGPLVKQTWQLWGPQYSNSREPAAVGPNLYSNLSSVLNSCPSAPTISGNKFWSVVGYILCNVNNKRTFDLPWAGSTPAGAHTNESDREGLLVHPGNEGDAFSFATSRNDAVVPTDPKSSVFTTVEDFRSIALNFFRLSSVSPNHTLCIAPTADEDLKKIIASITILNVSILLRFSLVMAYLIHRVGFLGSHGEGDVGIVCRSHL